MGLFGIKISLKNPFGPRSLFRTVARVAPSLPIPPISTVVGLASKAAAIAARARGIIGPPPSAARSAGVMPGGAPAAGPLPATRTRAARGGSSSRRRRSTRRKKRRQRR